jgi:hypothetical protein
MRTIVEIGVLVQVEEKLIEVDVMFKKERQLELSRFMEVDIVDVL